MRKALAVDNYGMKYTLSFKKIKASSEKKPTKTYGINTDRKAIEALAMSINVQI